jgi:hypothetical protein
MGQRTISGCNRSNNSHNGWPSRPKTAGRFRNDESQKPTISDEVALVPSGGSLIVPFRSSFCKLFGKFASKLDGISRNILRLTFRQFRRNFGDWHLYSARLKELSK